MYCRIRWYKVLRPHPSTWAIWMTGALSAWRAQGPKHVKTALLVRSTCRKKLNMFNLFRHVERTKKSFDMLPKTATCRTATFDMSKQRSTCRIRHVASTCCWCGRGFSCAVGSLIAQNVYVARNQADFDCFARIDEICIVFDDFGN